MPAASKFESALMRTMLAVIPTFRVQHPAMLDHQSIECHSDSKLRKLVLGAQHVKAAIACSRYARTSLEVSPSQNYTPEPSCWQPARKISSQLVCSIHSHNQPLLLRNLHIASLYRWLMPRSWLMPQLFFAPGKQRIWWTAPPFRRAGIEQNRQLLRHH